jgi:dipeptidyl aminopeptidase/acylaminoacyl peptidase
MGTGPTRRLKQGTDRGLAAQAGAALVFCASTLACAGAGSAAPATPQPAAAEPNGAGGAARAQPAPSAKVVAEDVPSGAAAQRDAELETLAAKFVDAFWNSGPEFTPDDKRVAFISNRDGLPQLYVAEVAQPEAAARRLFTWPERVQSAIATRDGTAFLFRSDRGADENWSYHRVSVEGQPIVELTPDERQNRDQGIIPDAAPQRLFYTARKMSEATSTLYEASTERAESPKVIYTDPKPTFLSDMSRDGSQSLLIRYPSRSENYLLLVDTASGQARTLFPASGRVSIARAVFSPDAQRVLVATDEGGERQHLLALDVTTGKEVARHSEPAQVVIQDVIVPKHGATLAIAVQAGDHSEVRLLNAKSLASRAKLALPLGAGGPVAFSEDGKRLSVTWSTANTPNDLYVVDVESAKVAPLRKEPRPTLAGAAPIKAQIQTLEAFDGGRIPVNVFVPEGELDRPHPVIVSYHGGPSGVSTVGWSPIRAFYLSLGYAVVEPNVRGSGGFGRAFEEADNGPKRLDAFKDVERSARWASTQPWADPERMVVYGGSYGGYTVLIGLTRWPDLWRAGVNLFGVAKLDTFMATTSGLIREIFLLEFGDPSKDAQFLEQISPLAEVERIVDPTFVYAGANDPRVPRSESDLIVSALRERGVPSEYMVAENEGHSLARRENIIAFLARSARFLEQNLRPPAAP